MCDKEATSAEHVPPKCFFPEKKDLPPGLDYRVNLITVPSCDDHNSSKSQDDEYMLLVLISHFENNIAAQRQFTKKMLRAIKRRPTLLQLLANHRPARVDGQPTIVFTVNRERFDRYINLIVRALHFNHYGEKWLDPILSQSPALFAVGGSSYQPISDVNRGIQYLDTMVSCFFENSPQLGENPEIFYYQIHRDEAPKLLVVKMVFYEGVTVISGSPPIAGFGRSIG
jgi:hypothetical protein